MADDLDTYDPVRGPARERIDAQELADADDRVSVILDRRRRRPRYFDDRFLTARDLTRGQLYTLLRQADLAQLSGAGVVHGLDVHSNPQGTQLQVEAGLGIARSGESMAMRERVQVSVAKLRVVEPHARATQLVAQDSASGPGTGLYVLVAHPVEYSRSAAATFPSASASNIVLADTEIVEGTWFTLMPLPYAGSKDVVARGRARLAREVFLGGFDPTLATDGLAIAVIGCVNGRVQWVDQALARREVGGDAVIGLGLQPRKRRLAHQAQYAQALAEELERRRNAGLPDGLPAIEAFAALPPVGPLPRGAVEVTATEVRQSFFPREIYVELAIMPEDELPALLSEGLVRAPIDLEAGSEALEGVPVLIVIPVPRAGFDQQTPRMEGLKHAPALAATGRQIVNARPIDALFVLRRKHEPDVSSDPSPLDLEAWRKAVESASQLWYVRRPQFAATSVVVPRGAGLDGEQPPSELLDAPAIRRLEDAGELARFEHLFGGSPRAAIKAINELLTSPLLDGGVSPVDALAPATETSVYVSGIMGELAYLARRPRPSIAADSTSVPSSPVFADIPIADRLRLRPIETGDVERVAQRFTLPGVSTALRSPSLRSPILRSVLASAAVVPELALWVQSPEGVSGGGVSTIASLAAAADIGQLRSIASGVTLPLPSPPDEPPSDSVESARSFALLERIGEAPALRAIWAPSHPSFRARLDELLASRERGSSPLFASATLMQTLTIGFALESQTDEQVRAILDALAQVLANREFRAPNGNDGALLGLARQRQRDAVLTAARAVPIAVLSEAQTRASRLGFAPGRAARLSADANHLLALASASFEHISAIANASDAQLDAFAQAARLALEQRSVTGMRKALAALEPGGPN